MTPSSEYEAAREAHNRALRAFEPVRDRYRAMKASHEEFIAAKALMRKADAEFDKAFEKEQKRNR